MILWLGIFHINKLQFRIQRLSYPYKNALLDIRGGILSLLLVTEICVTSFSEWLVRYCDICCL
jgi:hypothetical protein